MDNKPWVSASDAGKACYCPHSLELTLKGNKVSAEAEIKQLQGTAAHEVFAQRTLEDKRCFIASHLYGIDHEKTQLLRNLRDSHINRYRLGRMAIAIYYRVSPWWVWLARHSGLIDRCSRSLVEWIIRTIVADKSTSR